MAVTAAVLAALFGLADAASRAAVVAAAERLCATVSLEIARRAESALRAAETAIDEFEREVQGGLVRPSDPASAERALLGAATRRPDLAEAAFTWGTVAGRDDEGHVVLEPDGRGQVAVLRGAGGALRVRRTARRGDDFVAVVAAADEPVREGPAGDPTEHPTFVTPASSAFAGRTVWSDLHRAESGGADAAPRVVVAAQKAVLAPASGLAGVLRVSLATGRLDAVARLRPEQGEIPAGLRVFLCDGAGRLVAPAGPGGALEDTDDGLRVPAADVDAATAAALARPELRSAPADGAAVVARFEVGGRPHLAAFRALTWSQDWRVGVLVPEESFTGELERGRRFALAVGLAVAALLLAGGLVALRVAARTCRAVVESADRMRAFDFAPAPRRVAVREAQDVLEAVEQAKTSLRALGKFVPVDLVRRLHAAGTDPRPGGEMREATVMFSDIEGFTALAESMPPDELAELMASYFGRMTAAVHASHGIVDKFIGDAVMALWNAPEPTPGHPALACRAALACRDAERALLRSPEWAGRPRIRTRFGVHTDVVLVGHIGAPDRLNYTALGDGVNLASRLEGLNRHYGTSVLVSESVARAAAGKFDFRRIDRAAVKGRAGGVVVHELIGSRGTRGARHDAYEAALDTYLRRDFAAAQALFAALDDDPPARVLAARCARLAAAPPPAAWDGTFAHAEK
jgi:adenylate cyclase